MRGELLDRHAEGSPKPAPHPMVGDQTVEFVLGDVAFLRDDEALVDFEIRLSLGGRLPTKGRVVRLGRRWLLSYDSWANLQEMGGSPVPSLLDDAGNDD